MKQEWLMPGAVVPVDMETTAALVAELKRLKTEQEPVAWQVMVGHDPMKEFPIKDMAHDWCAKKKLSGSSSAYWIRPLYTAPRQWQGLTDEERGQVINANFGTRLWQMAKDIEAKLKEKNT